MYYYKRISDLKPLGTPEVGGDWHTLKPVEISPDGSEQEIKEKSMWLEVAVAKDKNGKPTGVESEIVKFEDKRLNVYELIKTIESYSSFSRGIQTRDGGVSKTNKLTTDVLKLSDGYISIFDDINLNNVKAKAINTETINAHTTNAVSITTDNINISEKGKIDNITGDSFNFSNIDFENLVVDEISSNSSADIETLIVNDIQASFIEPEEVTVDTKMYDSIDANSIHTNGDCIIEYFKADSNYEPGTVVRFGKPGESANWEITIANDNYDSTANGIIADKEEAGIILDNNINGTYILPVVLFGKTKVSVPNNANIAKFKKLYLSTQYIGKAHCSTEYGEPIAIALESHNSSSTEHKILCFAKFNLKQA